MLPEDVKRLERERFIAKARLGPNYSELKARIRAVKADLASRVASQRRSDSQERWGYYRLVRQRQNTTHERN